MNKTENILITGGSGNLGTEIIKLLLNQHKNQDVLIHNVDLRPSEIQSDRIYNHLIDIRSEEVGQIIKKQNIKRVIHLVAIIGGRNLSAEMVEDIEISGLRNVLDACVKENVEHFLFTSSGSVYGYRPDLPKRIPETNQLFNNHVIAYGKNKVMAEKLILDYRERYNLNVTVFRICSILGKNIDNLICRWFKRKRIIGLKGFSTPFSFIWDQDVANCAVEAIDRKLTGIYNLTGEGALTLKEIAEIQSKKYFEVNDRFLGRTLGLLNRISKVEYKKEYLDFIRYRPILDSTKFKKDFIYKIKMNSKEAFLTYINE